ncbi:MAG: hypothetical protein U0271_47065 [Polyangiaceae bacterium]
MDVVTLLPNAAAVLMASVATYTFIVAAKRTVGGQFSAIFKLLTGALVLSVLVHASVELAGALGLISERPLLWIMGGLIVAGSALFAVAGVKLVKLLS